MTQVTTVTGLTADRMIEMEAATIIDGDIQGNDLHLQTRGGTDINAGNVRGPQGIPGNPGTNGTNGAGDFICTSTTRPASPVNGFSIYETDTGLRRTWNGSRWRTQERVICTSGTRPSGLVAADEGIYIFETDLNFGHTWDGSRWKIDPRIVCTSATRPASLVAADEGVKIYETDTNAEYIWSGAAWVRMDGLPHTEIHTFSPSSSTNISGTVFQPWPPAPVGGPLAVTFNKYRDDTKLIARIMGTAYAVNSAGKRYTLGVMASQDSVDREISRHYINELGSHRQMAGSLGFSMPAGAYNFTGRAKTDSAPGVTAIATDQGNTWSLEITETL